MNEFKKYCLSFAASLAIAVTGFSASAQSLEDDVIVIPPLFEYVEAPEELPDLTSKVDYLMDNFWNPFDFKNSTTVDQNALNHAFSVYTDMIPYATEKKVKASVKKLIENIKKNPGLTVQFMKAAEESLYGPRAKFWADEIYMSFLENIISNKKVSEGKKKHYRDQYDLMMSSAVGRPLPSFTVKSINGDVYRLNPNGKTRLVGFITEESDNYKYTNLKLDISGKLNDMIDDNKLEVILVFLNDVQAKNWPSKWTVLKSADASGIMDLRMLPSFYILDPDNRIVKKNLNVDAAIDYLELP
ncbi:MAG: DUF5106 domain-containing protein [Muribaculaceae bacterium]|nr:DUF5106 domain-containing protein [Muribaculaceae bacterium]